MGLPFLILLLCFFKKKWAEPGLFLFILCSFRNRAQIWLYDKSVDGVLWTWTQDSRMEGADESTELWWPPILLLVCYHISCVVGLAIFILNGVLRTDHLLFPRMTYLSGSTLPLIVAMTLDTWTFFKTLLTVTRTRFSDDVGRNSPPSLYEMPFIIEIVVIERPGISIEIEVYTFWLSCL